jgi:Tfp pilus assembly protein PilF
MSRIEKLLALLKEGGADSFLQHALALEYIKLGRDEEAAALFRELLSREPSYVGSYYHLAKLLERTGDEPAALAVYTAGIEQAKIAGDNHARNELLMAMDELD